MADQRTGFYVQAFVVTLFAVFLSLLTYEFFTQQNSNDQLRASYDKLKIRMDELVAVGTTMKSVR